MKRKLFVLVTAAMMLFGMFALSSAAPLPAGCTKDRGTVTCVTFEPSPAKNQAGLGTTTEAETQGNTTNVSPAPQDLETTSTCKPAKSKGTPCR